MPPRLTTEQVRSRVRETDEGEYHLVGEYTSADRSITVLHEPCGRLIEVRAKGFLQEGDGRCRVCYPTAAKRVTPSRINSVQTDLTCIYTE